MIFDIFQTLPIPNNHLQGSYDVRLILLSFIVAMSASYIALDLTGRLRDANNTEASRLLWLIGGSVAMGAGIWAMHFIGMLSFTIPGVSLRYDPFWTVFSLLVAIIASSFALYLLQSTTIRLEHYIVGGIVLGLAIASMHYTGMEALLITLNIRYLPSIFFLSILIAIVASEAAIWMALKSNQVILRIRGRIKLISAFIMGIAICGMHYTGMAASIFTPLCIVTTISKTEAFDPSYLSVIIATVTFVILSIAFLASNYKEGLNQQQLERARQLGMAEISASVLHNVGNVLNSVKISTDSIAERVSESKLMGLDKLSVLLNEHKHNFTDFFQEPQGVKVVSYIDMLAKYWRDEKNAILNEINQLNKNLELITETISTQQELSKTTDFQQLFSVNELLDEALLITGLSISKAIRVEKHYDKIKPTKSDKVKLLQVLVNLMHNSKDALMESSQKNKLMILKTLKIKNEKIRIEISDNGIGISPKNLNKIFRYGFTTKVLGHGFGLHTSALSINAIGGEISVKSEGLRKGATFIIDLPVRN